LAFGYDGSIRIKADLNHSNFDRGLASMTNKVNSFGSTLKKIAGMVAVAFGTAALVNFAKESVKLASDIQEVQNVIDVTFGKGAAQIEEFAQSAATAFGLSELAAKQYTGTMGAMLKSSGLTVNAAQEMSIALTGLAGDIASFYNLDTDTAFEKIRSGISGETEPLKQLGINMSVANLEAYALSQGITKSYNAMSQAEQVMLRYNYLLSATTDAQGDFARTSGSFANQIRILQLSFDQLRIAVGNALIPIAEAVLPSINAIISGLTKLANAFAKVTALLFGKSPEVKATSGIAASAGAAADATNGLADATTGAGNAAKQTAKDMKGVLAGFDELNILASNAADSMDGAGGAGSGGGGLGAGAEDFEIPSYESEIEDVSQLEEAFESLGEMFVKALDAMLAAMPAFRQSLLDFAESFNEFNQKLYDAFTFPGVVERVEQLGRELAEAFNDLVNAIDWELWGRTLGAGLNLALQFLTEFLYTFDWINLGNKLAEFINGIVYEVDWYDFGRLLWAKFKLALETFAGFILGLDMPALARAASDIIMGIFDSMKETIANIDWGEIGRQVAEFLNNIDWVGIITSISGALKEMIPAALDLIGGFISNADPDTLLVAAAFLGTKILGKIGSSVLMPIAKEIAGNLIKDIAASITGGESGGILASIGSIIAKPFSAAKNAIWEFADGVSAAFFIAKNSSYTLSEAFQLVFGPASIIAGAAGVVGGSILAIVNFFTMLSEGFSWLNEILMLVGIAIAAVGAVLRGVPATVAAAVAGVIAAVATAVVLIKEHWEEIVDFFVGLWEDITKLASDAWNKIVEVWGAVSSWFDENIIQPVVGFFTELWENVTQLASDAWDAIVGVWEAVSSWFDENIIQPVTEFFTKLWEDITQLASDCWDAIVEVWDKVSTWFDENIIQPLTEFFTKLWEDISQFASDCWDAIVGVWEAVTGWFDTNVIQPVSKFFSDMWDSITRWASDAWDNIVKAFKNAGKWFEEHVTDPIGKAFEAVGNAIKGVLNGVIGAIEGVINGAIKGVNWLIQKINGLIGDGVLSAGLEFLGLPNGKIPTIGTVSLPRLANGAVIPPNQQFAAVLGDQRSGKNLEAPANLIRQMVAEGIQMAGGVGRSSGNMTIIMEIDGREFGRASYKYGTAEQQRVGVRLAEVRA